MVPPIRQINRLGASSEKGDMNKLELIIGDPAGVAGAQLCRAIRRSDQQTSRASGDLTGGAPQVQSWMGQLPDIYKLSRLTPMTRNSRRPAFVLVADLPQKSGPYTEPPPAARPWAVFVFDRASLHSRFA